MKTTLLVSTVLLSVLSFACSEAKFTGSSPSSSRSAGDGQTGGNTGDDDSTGGGNGPGGDETTGGGNGSGGDETTGGGSNGSGGDDNDDGGDDDRVSCSVSPSSIKLGRSVAIKISTGLSEGLKQTIKGAGTTSSAKLKRTSEGYVLESGAANNFKPTKVGSYVVELRRSNDSAAAATCQFKVTALDVEPRCEDSEQTIGAHLAFLIDNSNSNAATDCPSPVRTGEFNGASVYKCQSRTNREKAVLAAYDVLNTVAKDSGQSSARSTMAIASFPTKANFIDGWKSQTQGFVNVTEANRASIASAMMFSREPFGLTPYGAGIKAADQLFSSRSDDGKARVAILVTDGEPTDRDPNGVAAQAKSLRNEGVEVVTVFYTGSDTRKTRQSRHTDMLRGIDRSSVDAGEGHWYTSAYSSFSNYVSAILALPLKVTGGDQVVEVQDSDALEAVFMEIIETKAIRCER